MKLIKIFCYCSLGLLILATQSCSLRVKRDIVLRNLPKQDTSLPINIYVNENTLPQGTKFIGSLLIGDKGFTIDCDSITVFERARFETRRVGGNAFLLTDYSKPSFWNSNCHQIEGMILFVPDSLQDNKIVVPALSSRSDTALTVTDSSNSANVITFAPRVIERKLPIADFKLDLGYSLRTAAMPENIDEQTEEVYKKLRSGLISSLSADYFFSDGWGIKLAGYSFNSYYDKGIIDFNAHRSGTLNTKSNITFIGPAAVGRDALGKNNSWIISFYAGLGYVEYSIEINAFENNSRESGFTVGWQLGLDLDYKLNDNWGISTNLLLLSGIVTTVDLEENGKKQTIEIDNLRNGVGLGQVAIKAGVRYFINPAKKQIPLSQ